MAAQAGNYTYNAHIPLANWLRTANTMQKEVCCPGQARLSEADTLRPTSTKQKATTRRRTCSSTATPTWFSSTCNRTPTRASPRTAKRSVLRLLLCAAT